jgi:YegS/Rv2252/BmrU family lipid kinase
MERTEPLPATVFVNPVAGRGQAGRKVAELRAAFARRKYPAKIMTSPSAEEFRCAVRAAVCKGCATLVAMGGDGTLQMLVREVIGRDVRVGVIPAGGGNDFAAALGITKNVERAAEIIVRGETRLLDVVRVRDSYGLDAIYLGGGGIGIDAEALRYANGSFEKWPGRLRYLASAIAALRAFRGIQVQAEFPESDLPTITKRVLLAAVVNTPTLGGGLRLAPKAELDDGLLEVVMIEMLRKREVLALIPRLLLSGELKTERVVRIRAAKIKLTAEKEVHFQGDGEFLGKTPVQMEILHRALRMLTP